jgi:hypothetical protein
MASIDIGTANEICNEIIENIDNANVNLLNYQKIYFKVIFKSKLFWRIFMDYLDDYEGFSVEQIDKILNLKNDKKDILIKEEENAANT